MIVDKTVFILGAGASVPYNYPTGEELREDICRSFGDRMFILTRDISDAVAATSKGEADNFSKIFFASSTRSIDLFLARNEKFAKIGKDAIITSILNAEKKSSFREDMKKEFRGQDWYSYLFHRMTEKIIDPDKIEIFSNNAVTFITFNYDRSLEYFLYESLRNSFYSIPYPKIQELFSKIKIYHVYGIVDKLPWQRGLSNYGDEVKLNNLNPMSNNIRVIHERSALDGIDEMKRAIIEAQRVFFLGFGYAKENLDVLGLPSLLKHQNIYGTGLGFTEKEINDTTNYLRSHFGGRIDHPHIVDIDCRGLLRDWL